MGKFSKALKKEITKENLTKPIQETDKSDLHKAIPPLKRKEAFRQDQYQVSGRNYPDKDLADNSIDDEKPSGILNQDTAFTLPKQVASPIDTDGGSDLGVRSTGIANQPKADPSIPVNESALPPHQQVPNQRNAEMNISLMKPEIVEPVGSVSPLIPQTENQTDKAFSNTDAFPREAKNVRVSYSKTKVQVNDPEILKNNKIFSIFDDIETTDQIKILRTQVLRKLKAIGGNSILVTSAKPYEGKTFTSINLGVSIAKEFDRTVLIIDADIRKPTMQHTAFSTEFFTLQVEKGLTDYLMGDADISDILINPGIQKLTLIPGGMPVDNSSELLNSARMKEMMLDIKNRYPSDRIVIVDGPALLPYSDAMILSRYVDGVLPVIEAEKTSAENLKKMMQQLKEVNVLGSVLNKNKG